MTTSALEFKVANNELWRRRSVELWGQHLGRLTSQYRLFRLVTSRYCAKLDSLDPKLPSLYLEQDEGCVRQPWCDRTI